MAQSSTDKRMFADGLINGAYYLLIALTLCNGKDGYVCCFISSDANAITSALVPA